MVALARGGFGGKRLCSARRLDSGRNAGLLIGQHGEIALHTMSKREVRIGFEQGGESNRRIGSVREVPDDEMVVCSGRLGASGRKRQAAGIEMHGVVSTARPPLNRSSPVARPRGQLRAFARPPNPDGPYHKAAAARTP